MILITILAVLNTAFTFLALASLGRLIRMSRENMDAFVCAHNFQTRTLYDLNEGLNSALDCLLTIDARSFNGSGQAESSPQEPRE
ncbi:MAG: hypothetical protein ACJ71Q_09075 [Terriglobales bacterium]